MLRRRRPLLRAAAVGGTAYVAGRHAGRGQQENEEDQQESQEPQAEQEPATASQKPTSDAERVHALSELKELLDSGAITQSEFDSEKERLLHPDGA